MKNKRIYHPRDPTKRPCQGIRKDGTPCQIHCPAKKYCQYHEPLYPKILPKRPDEPASPTFPLAPEMERVLFHLFADDIVKKGALLGGVDPESRQVVYYRIRKAGPTQVLADVYEPIRTAGGRWVYKPAETKQLKREEVNDLFVENEMEFEAALRT